MQKPVWLPRGPQQGGWALYRTQGSKPSKADTLSLPNQPLPLSCLLPWGLDSRQEGGASVQVSRNSAGRVLGQPGWRMSCPGSP